MARQVADKKIAGRARLWQSRRGATAVELAIVLPVFLLLVFGMLDLGLAVFRNHVLAEAARQGARQAIVHGTLADKLGAWGPATITTTAANTGNPLSASLAPLLQGFDLSEVTITQEWLDAGNDPQADNRIRVTVSAPYHPMTFVFSDTTFTLSGSSTMYIAH